MKKTSYLSTILLLVAIYVVVAAISESYFFRIDLTEGGQYSLSDATENILEELDQPVTVNAYFTKDIAPDLAKVKNSFRDLLIEYNSISGGRVVYKFQNPNAEQKIENEALQAGVQPVLVNVREKDEVKQQKVFMGAVITMGTEKEVIPFVDPNSSLEYTLSTAIKKLSVTNKPKIGFVQGQGEPPVNSYQQVMAELGVLYDVSPVYLSDTVRNINSYKTLVIVAPKDSFDIPKLDILDNYLAGGGRLFLALNHVQGDLQNLTGNVLGTGMAEWLAGKGVELEDGFLVDSKCGMIQVSQRTNFGTMTSSLRFPYFPVLTNFGEHPATKGLEQVQMTFISPIRYTGDTSLYFPVLTNFGEHPATKGLEQVQMTFISPIRYTGDTSLTFSPLAYTSDQTGILSLPVYFDVNKKWTRTDFPSGAQVVAGLLEGNINGSAYSKMVIISNGDFAVNAGGNRQQADNISMMVNSIDWLSDDTGLIDLRTKTITSRPIEQLTDAKKNTLRWVNFLLPLVLVIIYGLIRMQIRRNQRIRRMEEGYVK
jgi:ABC-type uncharacterized transport system involved in gliding motility auxiliary subunit